jgi:hypothetical protein
MYLYLVGEGGFHRPPTPSHCSGVLPCGLPAESKLAVGDQVAALGSYSSALAVSKSAAFDPPTTRTLPFESGVAVWKYRGVDMPPVADQVPATE